jgi:hypothetical protein
MISALENLATSGPLRAEPVDGAEYEGLMRSGRARLTDARRSGLMVHGFVS